MPFHPDADRDEGDVAMVLRPHAQAKPGEQAASAAHAFGMRDHDRSLHMSCIHVHFYVRRHRQTHLLRPDGHRACQRCVCSHSSAVA